MTDGARGATLYGPDGSHFQPAVTADVVDTTGAGDAFLSGLLHYLAVHGVLNSDAMALAAKWAALTVSTEGSIPPRFH